MIILSIIIYASLYGVLMESIQLAVPGREFNLVDLVADILGALAGNFIYIRFVKLKKGLGQ
jgi:VanZ family protein